MADKKSIEDHERDFRDAMAAVGIPYSGPLDGDGKLRRFYVDGDKKGTRNGWLIWHADERPAGAFGSGKDIGQKHKWTAKGLVPLTDEERAEMAERRRRDKEAAQRAEAERHAAAAALAAEMWANALEVTDHPYLTRKGVLGYGLRAGDWVKTRADGTTYVGAKNALLIPIKSARGMVSLQAIFAAPVTVGESKRDKDFVYGGEKRGCFFTIGRPTEFDGIMTVVIVEGYATGATVHRATGVGVVVAFDAGNLLPVAQTVRRLMPDVRIIIAADNDQWTLKPRENPGVWYANEAAKDVGADVVIPYFTDVSTQPTDFNDLEKLEGREEVQRQMMALLKPPVDNPLEAPAADAVDPDRAAAEYAVPKTGAEQQGEREEIEDELVNTDGYFRVLGHDADSIYVYQYEKRMITQRGETDWSENAMITLAPIHWWEMQFPGGSKDGGFNRKAAFNWLVRTAYKRGFFDPSSRRGRGAWRDDGRIVYHFGNQLWVDGEMLPVTSISSSYVYEQARRLRHPAPTAMSGEDGRKIVESAKLFHWTRPASALLLCGYVALAPICGAISWRPHIWLTGGAGSGKTTILKEWLWPLLNGCCVFAQGNSTEAGIRQTLKSDSLPVLFDESEQNDEREAQRVQGVLSMIRQSSTESEARTLKGTAGGDAQDFMIRSMFCLSSIQVGMHHQADYERIAVLALQPKREGEDGDKTSAENWAKLSGMLSDLRGDVDLPARLMRRTLSLLPVTLKNIEVFSRAAAEAFGSQRDGDQYGTLIAGAWSLFSTEEATLEQAHALIKKYDWGDYRENTETEESTKALNALMGRLVRHKGGDVSVYELVERVALPNSAETMGVTEADADKILRRHGMMVRRDEKRLLVSNTSHALRELMAGTAYAADLKGQLLRVPDAERHAKTENFAGERAKAVSIPLYHVIASMGRPMADIPEPSDLIDDNIAF